MYRRMVLNLGRRKSMFFGGYKRSLVDIISGTVSHQSVEAMKRILFITLGIIIGCSCIAQTSRSSVPHPVFSIVLSPPAGPISAASPINIKVTVQNISGKDIPWTAQFADTAYKAFLFSLDKDGKEVETTFFYRKITDKQRAGDPNEVSDASSFLGVFAAGKSFTETIDLKRLYQITGPGSYTLGVSRYDDESATMVSSYLTLKIGP